MKDTYSTVIVDLTRSEEEILKSIEKSARNGITKAQREGLTVQITGKSWDSYALYRQMMIFNGLEPKTEKQLDQEGAVFFVCKKDENIIAEASLHLENERITLYTNSSLKEYQKFQPNNLLYWECIRWAKQMGYKELDLGGFQTGAGAEDSHLKGINDFKRKWGQVVTFEKDYPVLTALGRKAIKTSPFLWKLNKKIRRRK